MKEKFAITGMSCSACSAHVEKSVAKVMGVNKVSVNLLTNSMQVYYDDKQTSRAEIIAAVKNAGYGAAIYGAADKTAAESTGEKIIKSIRKRLLVSIIFLLPLLYISMGHMIYEMFSLNMPDFMSVYFMGDKNALVYSFTQFLLTIPIILVNYQYFENGFKLLFKRSPNMDTLIAIGAGAAAIYGIFSIYRIGYGLGYNEMSIVRQYRLNLYFESAGMILTLITVGKYLEAKSKGKTSEAIKKLVKLTPKTATVLRNGVEQIIKAEDIIVGDVFIVKPGETAAVDGIVIEGESFFDESTVTGESVPVRKTIGDKLVSASINKAGFIHARAVKVGTDTTIAQIIKLVEEASASKAPIARLADRAAGVFVPVVIIVAVITGAFWLLSGAGMEFSISTAIAVLVISCPCALGLATPVAIMVGTGKGAQNGILIKSGEALQAAQEIDTVVLDKTGTITQGKPQVTDVISLSDVSAINLLKIVGSLEKGSEHPLARAIVNKCAADNIELMKVSSFKALFGKGIEGIVDNKMYYAGNQQLMQEKKIIISLKGRKIIKKLSEAGKTPLIFAVDKKIIGIVAVADVVKTTSGQAVKQLKKYGMHVIMLTGDNEITANAIKAQTGIDEVIAGVLPAQKEAKVTALRHDGHKVAMVGDGINDAPALAAADVGIAIGAGTDVAIESADVVLMRSDLLDVGRTIRLSKAVIKNIKENLFWAFFYNIIGIPLAAGVFYPAWGIHLNPMFAAAAMSLSSVCVVMNALRLKRLQLRPFEDKEDLILEHSKTIDEEKGDNNMKKIVIMIEGMSCGHCTARVETALRAVNGVTDVKVSLEEKNAVVSVKDGIAAEVLKNAVVDVGYDVVGIK
ncbi:heavy metal translocating P-type ATPase [Pectinatus sottacetonis]|uniref:heavy metal translocating P-type ATPase n=1 Tax=Pectinatus sottacetonis TaxID=1002795 RepID=UPI0018C5C5F0|nr:heavy metal translocating P-type ATPase [Pectinatus sottacetonis]